jgi:hypothetical protein
VSDTEKFAVGGPVIGYQPGLRGDSAGHEGMYFAFAKALDPFQPSNTDAIGFASPGWSALFHSLGRFRVKGEEPGPRLPRGYHPFVREPGNYRNRRNGRAQDVVGAGSSRCSKKTRANM